MIYSKIVKMGYVIQEFILNENSIHAKPKDLMPILIEKGFLQKIIGMAYR